MAQQSIKVILLLFAFLLLIGCSTPKTVTVRKTVTVEVPVYTPIQPPAYLLEPVVISAIPVFFKPGEKGVTSCLKPAGEVNFKQTIFLLSARVSEWLSFSSTEKVNHD